jgi:hypothetical protein
MSDEQSENTPDQTLTWFETFVSAVSSTVVAAGIIGVVAGPLVFAWQCYAWLKFGVWTPVEIQRLWGGHPIPSTGWLGVDKMIRDLVDIPLSLSIFAIGVLVLVAGFALEEYRHRHP